MEFFPKVVFVLHILGKPIPVTETVIVTWGIMAVLIVSTYLVGKNFRKIPQGIQNVVEAIYEGIENLIKVTMGEKRPEFIPYVGTLALFLLVANLIDLIALRPPTADLSTTLALALITFVLTQIEGARKKGVWGYLKGFFKPLAFMAPLNFIGALTNPFSLAFRLLKYRWRYGYNEPCLYCGTNLYTGATAFLFRYVFGILQTFIFIMLTLTFISMAAD